MQFAALIVCFATLRQTHVLLVDGAGEGRDCVGPVQLLLGVTSKNSVGGLYAGLAFANLAFWLLTDPDGYARNFPIAILPVGE